MSPISTQSSDEAAWAARYAQVQHLADIDGLVRNGTVYPRWISASHSFWYDCVRPAGVEYRIVDAETGDNQIVVTHRELVAAISHQLGRELPADRVILRHLDFALGPTRATFEYAGRAWRYEVSGAVLSNVVMSGRANWKMSPDGTRAISVRGYNLWVHNLVDGTESQATTDGSEDNAYGIGPSGMRSVHDKYKLGTAPEGLWSPDSRLFFTLQTDERHVPELPMMTFVPSEGLRPTVQSNRRSTPGDPRVTEFRLFALDARTGRQVEPRHPRLSSTRMMDTPFTAETTWWAADSRTVYVVALERGELAAQVIAFDVRTGNTSTLFTESAEQPLELSVSLYDPALIAPLVDSNEVIWYSERTGRGHLYLYDLATGALKRPLTHGEWQVRELLRVDPRHREVYFLAGGIASDEDPYVRKTCVAGLDDGAVRVISGELGDHRVWRPNGWDFAVLSRTSGSDISRISGFSPDGEYFVETVGDIDRLPQSVLRHRSGEQICVVETAEDIGLPADWRWPQRVRAVAADGVTDVYGLLFTPTEYNPERSYPLIDLVYGGVQETFVPKSAFVDYPSTSTFVEAAGYAALGAFCLVLDGRGTACRERSFRLASYGAVQTVSNIEDHIATIERLAERHPIDRRRVGITGFSGGGYLAALAALRHGDFFSVAVAASGNYDLRLSWYALGERYHGRFEARHYERQAAKTYAPNLSGHLLLIHGLLDSVHPAGLFQLVQALIDENKDVDLIVLPTTGHEITGYGMRRRLDYFVTHLFGSTPPSPVRMLDPRSIVMEKERANDQILAALALAGSPGGRP